MSAYLIKNRFVILHAEKQVNRWSMDDLSTQPVRDQLTQRELDILRLITDGPSNQDVAERLFITKEDYAKGTENAAAGDAAG